MPMHKIIERDEVLTYAPISLEAKVKDVLPTKSDRFIIQLSGQHLCVKIMPKATILNLFWLRASIRQFQIGDTVHVHGTVTADATIQAVVVRDIDLR